MSRFDPRTYNHFFGDLGNRLFGAMVKIQSDDRLLTHDVHFFLNPSSGALWGPSITPSVIPDPNPTLRLHIGGKFPDDGSTNDWEWQNGDFSYLVRLCDLLNSPPKYCVYRLRFEGRYDADNDPIAHPSFDPIRLGYVGMTGQRPLDRFRQHMAKASRGEGYALHRAWSALLRAEIGVVPSFQICAVAKTKSECFDVEEQAVDELGSLIPNGLNVIRGGMAGVRELWKLGALSVRGPLTVGSRDAALEALEDSRNPVSAHYRSGHIRRLPHGKQKQFTWVNPCWVGLKSVEAA